MRTKPDRVQPGHKPEFGFIHFFFISFYVAIHKLQYTKTKIQYIYKGKNTLQNEIQYNAKDSPRKPWKGLVGFIILPSQDTSNLSTMLNLCCDPKGMDSVLPRCKDNLLSTSHYLQDSSSLLKTSEITFGSLWDVNRALSSAYRRRLQLKLVGMSLT